MNIKKRHKAVMKNIRHSISDFVNTAFDDSFAEGIYGEADDNLMNVIPERVDPIIYAVIDSLKNQ